MNQEINIQQKKQLPRRASRGVRAQQSQLQKKQDDQVYNRLFGNLQDSSEQDQSFSQQLGLRPLQTFTANFANYNYGRGYHYFFNLDTFKRVEGSPSYALDDQNRFKHTYSHDDQQINGTKLNKLINRHYIGLPKMQTTYGNSKNKDKNVCHYHLFNIQDKKYYNHRIISKYKYVLKHLDKLQSIQKLKEYTQLKKDVTMYEVCQEDVSKNRKRELLQSRIKVLQQRVKNMSPYWDWEDKIYYRFSLDQIFHNQALAKGQRLSVRNLKERIFDRITTIKQYITSQQQGSVTLGAQKPKRFIQNWLQFEQQKANILSQQMQSRLKNSMKMIQMFRRKQQLITIPSFIFNFGNAQKAVDTLLKGKLEKEHESGYYIYKGFIKKLFRRDFLCQQQSLLQPMMTQEYTKIMKNKLERIQQFYEEQQSKQNQKNKIIDDLVQIDKIEQSPVQQHVDLFQYSYKIQITLKQLMLLFLYRNISIALTQFIDYINCDPQILRLMTNSNYEKYHYGIANIVHQQEFCILLNDIERFIDILNNSDISSQFNQTLYYTYNKQMGVGYVWTQNQNDQWETEKEQSEQDQQLEENGQNSMKDVFNDGDPKPLKKVKFD